jgi:Protein of unknown function (DUF4232)
MRFHAAGNPRARPAVRRGLSGAAARGRRTVTFGLLGAAACGLAMTACGSQNAPSAVSSTSTQGSPSAGSSSAGADACGVSQLKISLSDTSALAGQAGGYIKFTNHSDTTCRMSGWPVVIGLTAANQATRLRQLQSSMFGAWHYTAPPPVVTLRPGDSAYAIVAADDKPAGSSAHCPAPYVRLEVSPPGESAHMTISAWLPGAASYLPACTSADGSPTAGTSTITTLSSLPH